MEHRAANTLRTLAIILTAGFALVAGLFLFLMSICAYGGGFSGSKHPEQGLGYLISGIVVMVLGVAITISLGRGIVRSAAYVQPAGSASVTPSPSPEPGLPADLLLSSRKAIEQLILAMAAQIGLSALTWFWSQWRFWTRPHGLPPHNWILVLLTPFVLYHVPYAILIYGLFKKPDRRTFAYSLAVPAVLIMQALLSLSVVSIAYRAHPIGLLLTFVPWALHIVVLILAWRAIQQLGTPPASRSLVLAALVAFLYFSAIQVLAPLLYKFAWSSHG